MTKKEVSDEELSATATDLIRKIMIYADEYSFEDGMSDDMKAVEVVITDQLLEGVIISRQGAFKSLTRQELEQFKNSFYEAIGVGYKIYWSEKKYIKNDEYFVKFKGEHFQNYLLQEYENYFVNLSKNPENITPSYVHEVCEYFSFMLYQGAYTEGDKIKFITKMLDQLDQNDNLLGTLRALLQSVIWTGYILCITQDEYQNVEGIEKSH